MIEKLIFSGVFARLTYLAITCPCDPLFKCHSSEVVLLVGGSAAIILFRQLNSQ